MRTHDRILNGAPVWSAALAAALSVTAGCSGEPDGAADSAALQLSADPQLILPGSPADIATPTLALDLEEPLSLHSALAPPLLPAAEEPAAGTPESVHAQTTAATVPVRGVEQPVDLDDTTLQLAPRPAGTADEPDVAASHVVLHLREDDGWGATVGGRGGPEHWQLDGDGVVPGRLDQGNPLAVFGGVAYTWESGATLSLIGGVSLDRKLQLDGAGDPARLLRLEDEPQPFVGVLLRTRF